MNNPIPFPGTKDEARLNYASHQWAMVDEFDVRCMNCDARPSHVAADYPCGTEPPRSTR